MPSFNFPLLLSGLVQKGGERVSPVQSQMDTLFWAFWCLFWAFLGFFLPVNLGRTPESAKRPKIK